MVEIATALGRSGLQDWLIQRVTALILGIYTVFIVVYLCINPDPSYSEWRALFASEGMRYGTTLALLSLLAHAWIGLWTVTTDYLKPVFIRLPLQMVILLSLLICFFWGLDILWSL